LMAGREVWKKPLHLTEIEKKTREKKDYECWKNEGKEIREGLLVSPGGIGAVSHESFPW
jgi:hypothetical protein